MRFFTSPTNSFIWVISDKNDTALAINREGRVFDTNIVKDTFTSPDFIVLKPPQVIEWLRECKLTLNDLWETK